MSLLQSFVLREGPKSRTCDSPTSPERDVLLTSVGAMKSYAQQECFQSSEYRRGSVKNGTRVLPHTRQKGHAQECSCAVPSTIEISNISCIKRAIYRGFLTSRVYSSARNCEAMEACNDDKTHSNERIGKQRTSLRPGLVTPDVAHLRSAWTNRHQSQGLRCSCDSVQHGEAATGVAT